jgi:hypothetical protein
VAEHGHVPTLPARTGGELWGVQEVGTITACFGNYYLSQNIVAVVQFSLPIHQYASGQCVLIWCYTQQAGLFVSLPSLTVPSSLSPLAHPASVKIRVSTSIDQRHDSEKYSRTLDERESHGRSERHFIV